MKRNYMFIATMVFFTMLMACGASQNKTITNNDSVDINIFPQPKAGYKMVYVNLPAEKNENDLQIELSVGKDMEVDCNRHFMIGNIKKESLQGWGYDYYTVESNGNVGSTRMACPDNNKTVKFVTMQPELIRYNSKLPIIIYVPNELNVKYRIWRADKQYNSATNGPVSTEEKVSSPQIEDKRWQLTHLNGKPIESKSDTHYIILHTDEKRAEAKANCNSISMNYELKNEFQLRFSEGMTTMMACPDDEIEKEFVEVLNTVDNFTTDGKTLSLNKARMAPLAVFKLVE